MKVLVVHNRYQQSGGEKTAVSAQIELLRARGHCVVTYTRDNLEIRRYNRMQKAAFLFSTMFSTRTYREVSALCAQEQPDVAHVHNVFPLISPAVYRALKNQGVPIIQTMHNFRFMCVNGLFYTQGHICERCKYGNMFHAIIRKCYRQSYVLSALYALTIAFHRWSGTFQLIDRFIALTEFTAQKLVESGLTDANKVVILGNFLSSPMPAPGRFDGRAPYVIYLGRLSPEKGVDILLDAMANLPDLELKIAGDGPQRDTLQTIKRERHLNQVEFLGLTVGEQKWRLVREARALVVPSVWYETFGLSALESLAVGTPVVASNIGGLADIVRDGKSGLLFHPGDSQDLRRKLLWLEAHPEQAMAMGRYGRRVVEEQYSAEAHYGRLLAIYEEIRN